VLLGHWEARRHFGETDDLVNRKLHRTLEAGLRPILLVGESKGERDRFDKALLARLPRLLAECDAGQVGGMSFVYEPEWSIGMTEPAPPKHVAAGCRLIRQWLARTYGHPTAQTVRIIYGGSVRPQYGRALLEAADMDGLGASRKGRQVESFAQIVRLIAAAKGVE